jgi:DNA-binding transcriptional ArsR family regulator
MNHEKQVIDFENGTVEVVNDNFVQIYVDHLRLIMEMNTEQPTAVTVFTWLLEHMDKRNALVVSQQALSEALSLSIRTIQYAISYLREKKAIDVIKSGNTNIYVVNARIAWKSYAQGKKHAMFSANVYVSETEQEKAKFDTQLIGHAKPRTSNKREKKLPEA